MLAWFAVIAAAVFAGAGAARFVAGLRWISILAAGHPVVVLTGVLSILLVITGSGIAPRRTALLIGIALVLPRARWVAGTAWGLLVLGSIGHVSILDGV